MTDIVFCPKCGSANPESSEICGVCGFTLTEAASSLRGEAVAGSMNPQVAAAVVRPPSSSGKAHHQTMLGVAMPGTGNQTPPAEGVPPTLDAPHLHSTPPSAVHQGGSGSQRMGTMLGVAMPAPGSAPMAPRGFAPPSSQGRGTPPSGAPTHPGPMSPSSGGGFSPVGGASSRPKVGTMMGVAAPAPGSQRAPQQHVVASSPDRPLPTVRTVMRAMVQQHGDASHTGPHLLEQAFRESVAREMDLLMKAQQAGVPTELTVAAKFNGVAACVDGLVHRLAQQYRLSPADARFAVETWGIALGVVTQP